MLQAHFSFMVHLPTNIRFAQGTVFSVTTLHSIKNAFACRRWLVSVNDKDIADLDSLLQVVRSLDESQPLRLVMVDLQGRRHCETLKLDTRYWYVLGFRDCIHNRK